AVPVVAAHEGEDSAAPGHLAGELQSGLDRVGPGGTGERDAVVETAGLQDLAGEGLQEGGRGRGVQVEPVGHPVLDDVVDQGGLDQVVVVPVVEGTGAGQEVEV